MASAVLALLALAVAATGQAPIAMAQQPEIVWRVNNPFRFFLDPADTEMHRATFASLKPNELQSPVLAIERALEERHPDGWAASVFTKTCWDPVRNRYACQAYEDYVNPKFHKVLVELKGIEDAQSVDCSWATAPRGGRRRGAAVTLPCDAPIELQIPYPGGAHITVEVGGRLVAETDARVEDLFVVGMGDSFGSGEGNPDLPVRFSRERSADYGTGALSAPLTGYPARVGDWRQIGDAKFIQENARWLDQACHRSLYSYQLRAALQLAIEEPHRAVTYVGVACSGAETTFGLFLRYKGNEWVPNPPELSQISSIAQAQCGRIEAKAYDLPEAYHMQGRIPELEGGLVLRKCDAERGRKIDLVLLSIGGNDVGFARLVANAVLNDSSVLRQLGGWFGQVHGVRETTPLLDVLGDHYKSVNRAIHSILHVPWPEADRIILTGYPPLAVLADGRSICPDGQAGMTVLPDFTLSARKAREGGELAERLDTIMRDSAKAYGWSFVDEHRAAFRGRGICAGWTDAAFSTADDLRIPRKVNGAWEPFNPADWRAYVPRQRWFRTPNDAFMTGNFHVSQSILQSVLKAQGLSWVQLLLAATYSGAFHPTAEGQAAIADAVVVKARQILRKYEAGEYAER